MGNKALFKYLTLFLFTAVFFAANTGINAQRRVTKKTYKRVVHVHPPNGAVKIAHRNVNYHFVDGVFYKLKNDKYVVIKSPRGIRISILPSRAKAVHIGGIKYHYYYGTYYEYLPDLKVYEVVDNPKADSIITDEILLIDGRKLEGFYLGGTSSLVQFEVHTEVLEIPVEDIVTINFAPLEE